MSEGPNPFEPPKSDWSQSADEPVGYFKDASQGARLMNSILDALAQGLLVVLVPLVGFGEVMILFVILAYYPFFETAYGKTPGKWITKTRVVTETDERPTLKHILVRTLVRFVPFEALSFLVSARGWHDVWSGTRVVRDRKRKRRKRRG